MNKLSPNAYPFCDEWTIKLSRGNPGVPSDDLVVITAQFEHHVGSHMEYLTLLALPRGNVEENTSTGAATSQSETYDLTLHTKAKKILPCTLQHRGP